MSNPYEKYVAADNPYMKYAAPPQQVAPEPQMPTPASAASDAASSFLQAIPGGPIGMMAAGANAGMQQLGKISDYLGYKAGGAVTDLAAPHMSPEAAGALGYGTNLAIQAVPTLLGGEAAKVFSPSLQSGARSLMQSALKPTMEMLNKDKGRRAAETMLKEGVSVTEGGVRKMQGLADEISAKVDDIIKNSTGAVDKNAVANYLRDVISKFKNRPNAQQAEKIVEDAWTQFLEHPMVAASKGPTIPVQTAQDLKRGYQASVSDKGYGQLKDVGTEAEKALARGLRENISAAEPAVAGLNARDAELINAINVAKRRVLMDANKNPIGLGWLNPLALPLWLWDRSPLAKSLTARMLNAGSAEIPANVARAGIASQLGGTPE